MYRYTGEITMQRMDLCFRKEFPSRFCNTFIDSDHVFTIMTWLAGAVAYNDSALTYSQLQSALEECFAAENLAAYPGNTETVIKELTGVFELLREEGGYYNFCDYYVLRYFATHAITGGKGITLEKYLSDIIPDYMVLLWCTRKAYSAESGYAQGEKIINFAISEMKDFMDKYPNLIKYFDIDEEMPQDVSCRSPFGDHMCFLISVRREFSPLMSREKAYEIYDLIFRVKGVQPDIRDAFDRRQCWLEFFSRDNAGRFPQVDAAVYIAGLLKKGVNPFTCLIQQITDETDENHRRFLTAALIQALTVYGDSPLLEYHYPFIPQKFKDLLDTLSSGEDNVYRQCLDTIKNRLALALDVMAVNYSCAYRYRVCNLAENPFEEDYEDVFVNTPLSDKILDYVTDAWTANLKTLHGIYAPRFYDCSDPRLALRYFKILAMTGYWHKSQLTGVLAAADSRFRRAESFSWEGIGAETPRTLPGNMDDIPPAVTYKTITEQLAQLSACTGDNI